MVATQFKKGHSPSEESRKKMSDARKGKTAWNKGLTGYRKGEKHPWMPRGEKHWNYKKDRSLLAKKQIRNDGAYIEWRKQVWKRDRFTCRIANADCNGRIEAHHILIWSEYPELRYQLNNGITLCHAHHPRKRAEEKRLVSIFQELVSVSND